MRVGALSTIRLAEVPPPRPPPQAGEGAHRLRGCNSIWSGTRLHLPAARCVRVVHRSPPSNTKRAQGMPGAGRTHGPPATKNAGGSHHRYGRNIRHSLRDGFTAYTCAPRSPGLLASVARGLVTRRFDPSVGGPR